MRARRAPRRGRTEERVDRLRRALQALGPPPRDALGRWTHQEQVWRLQREIDDLLDRHRQRRAGLVARWRC